jgi:hypothetical protein
MEENDFKREDKRRVDEDVSFPGRGTVVCGEPCDSEAVTLICLDSYKE